jgi:hypothetical protein
MKILKITIVLVSTSMLAMLIYANTRNVSPTEKLSKVHLATFQIGGELTSTLRASLTEKISKITGVTACSMSKEGNVVAIIFHPDQVTEATLSSLLQSESIAVSTKEFGSSTSGGCPVHAVGASVSAFVSFLDLRN